jgi:hypothetical protein
MARSGEDSEVLGHYLLERGILTPLLSESSQLFVSVVTDQLQAVEAALESNGAAANQPFLVLQWSPETKAAVETAATSTGSVPKTSVTVKQRTLLMVAAHAGALRAVAALLNRGADPSRKGPDGMTAYEVRKAAAATTKQHEVSSRQTRLDTDCLADTSADGDHGRARRGRHRRGHDARRRVARLLQHA